MKVLTEFEQSLRTMWLQDRLKLLTSVINNSHPAWIACHPKLSHKGKDYSAPVPLGQSFYKTEVSKVSSNGHWIISAMMGPKRYFLEYVPMKWAKGYLDYIRDADQTLTKMLMIPSAVEYLKDIVKEDWATKRRHYFDYGLEDLNLCQYTHTQQQPMNVRLERRYSTKDPDFPEYAIIARIGASGHTFVLEKGQL